jgi:uncharacterized membrane protein
VEKHGDSFLTKGAMASPIIAFLYIVYLEMLLQEEQVMAVTVMSKEHSSVCVYNSSRIG